MRRRILSYLQEKGYDQNSRLREWELNQAFDKILSRDGQERQFNRNLSSEIWEMTDKNQYNQVLLGQYLQNMEDNNMLGHLIPTSQIDSEPNSDFVEPAQQQDEQSPQIDESQQQQKQNNAEVNLEQYSERESRQVGNRYQQNSDALSYNINATVNQSIAPTESLIESEISRQEVQPQVRKIQQPQQLKPIQTQITSNDITEKKENFAILKEQPKKQEIVEIKGQRTVKKQSDKKKVQAPNTQQPKVQKEEQKQKSPKKKSPKETNPQNSLQQPLLQRKQLTEEQRQDEIYKSLPYPSIKKKPNSSVPTQSLRNSSIASQRSLISSTYLSGKDIQGGLQDEQKQNQEDKKFCSKRWCIPITLLIIGAVIFFSSFIIKSALKSKVIDQIILQPKNQGIWAHWPGDTKTQIDRNWTFFNITNADRMLFYNEKPVFREIQGFKIIELEDYLNITYIDDGDRVQMIDWLHFGEQPQSRNLSQKVKILNVGGLAYWYNIKVARPTIILQQGLGILFTTLEQSIIENIYAQAINLQFLPEWSDVIYDTIFSQAQIPYKKAIEIWQDPAYGMGNQDNLKYWIDAVSMEDDVLLDQAYIFLMDYFDLTNYQMSYIIAQFEQFVTFSTSSVLQNHYCANISTECNGRYLAYQQFANSSVTRDPPPGKPVTPNNTICESNVTCKGSYPQIWAFYQEVYLKRNPGKNASLTFDPQWMRQLVDYNVSIQKGKDYNTAEHCLFHIGNLDALWDNGTLYDQSRQQILLQDPTLYKYPTVIQNKYLKNIQDRFKLPSSQHTHVFWQWIKYLNYEVILSNQTNEKLGVANLFANGLYEGFSYLQDNLQRNLLIDLIHFDLNNQSIGDCSTFIRQSLEIDDTQKALDICNPYGQKFSKKLVEDMFEICSKPYYKSWQTLKSAHKLLDINLVSLCQVKSENETTFGNFLHNRRKYMKTQYSCSITKNGYCSDYQLAVIQWSTSNVTLNPPPQLNLNQKRSYTYKDWDSKAQRFQYGFYKSKYPDDHTFPNISILECFKLLNFDNWFSAPVVLKHYTNSTYNQKFKAYMRYVGIQVGLNGLTMQRTARQLIFGYEDQILNQIKHAYPPFGGDPSTPSLIAFNDPNITQSEATMTLEWNTGKYDSSLLSQYRKINGLPYLTIEKDFFNGNVTQTQLISPWQGQDYVYGTSAKMFAPNQFEQPNISLYVPNIQRYGSGVIDDSVTQQRYGFQLQVGYLGDYIYQSTSQSDINKKYYQNFRAIFNETSVVGFPLFVCKNHFMNVSSNWSTLVQIYNENGTIKYENASEWDDSFVIVEPYSGVSFQSTIYLQSNYYHTPDSLLSFYNESLLPLFALARSGNVTEQTANNLLGPLKLGLSVVKWTKIIGIVIIVVASLICGYIYYQKKKQQKARQGKDDQGNKSRVKSLKVKEEKKETKKKSDKKVTKSSQLGISMQPMSKEKPKQLIRQEPSKKQQYVPVVQQQI